MNKHCIITLFSMRSLRKRESILVSKKLHKISNFLENLTLISSWVLIIANGLTAGQMDEFFLNFTVLHFLLCQPAKWKPQLLFV